MSTPSVCFESRSFSFSSSAPPPRPPSRPPAQERGPRRRPEPRTITRTTAWHTPITDESWRLRVRGADGSRATSIRAGGDAPDTRDFFVKPGSERPFYTTVRKGTQYDVDGRSHQLVGPTIERRAVRPPSVSTARPQGPRRSPDSARARSTVCARARQSQSSGGACRRRQTAADTSASARCPVGGGSSPMPAERSRDGHAHSPRA